MDSQKQIPQMIPDFDHVESNALAEYMSGGGFLTEHIKTRELEKLIADYVGSRNCIMVSNGTVSLMLMFKILGIGPGDEVIVPNYTMFASASSVSLVGATPVFVDVEASSLCLDIKLIEKKITKNTKAILFVSSNGRNPSYPINDLNEISKKKGLYLLEDAAQSLGSYYPNGSHIGTEGLMGSFSFSVPKIITTGQGGCIVTDDDELAKRLRLIKDFGRSKPGADVHESIGGNFKFTDLQAVIGIAQMSKLQGRVIRKKEIWTRYAMNLSDCKEVRLFKHNVRETAPWFIDILAEKRNELEIFLHENGISTRRMYSPITSQKPYRTTESYPVSEDVGEHGIWLPSFVQILDSDIDLICQTIQKFYSI